MTDFEKLYLGVVQSFDKLWSSKMLDDNTIEIITPYSTTTSKFVSLFLTKREDKYIVSDGGLLYSESYETYVDYENQCLLKALYHFESFYDIKMTKDPNDVKHYFKTTTNFKLIPNLVYDLAQFISFCASTASIEFEDESEIRERNSFRKTASTYIGSNYTDYNIKYYGSLDRERYRSVRFGAVIEKNSRLNLVNFITGSTSANFINSIAKSNLNFSIAGDSIFQDYIDSKLVFLNDSADGYNESRLFNQINALQSHLSHNAILWSHKEQILEIIHP